MFNRQDAKKRREVVFLNILGVLAVQNVFVVAAHEMVILC
jgi:hypothetical protein